MLRIFSGSRAWKFHERLPENIRAIDQSLRTLDCLLKLYTETEILVRISQVIYSFNI